jgi:hypothetical protein
MAILDNLKLKKAQVRSKAAGLKGRMGARSRGAMFGSAFSGLQYRVSRVRSRNRLR